jgi:hypothetical protein
LFLCAHCLPIVVMRHASRLTLSVHGG